MRNNSDISQRPYGLAERFAEKRQKGIRKAKSQSLLINPISRVKTATASIGLYIITYYNMVMAEMFKAKVRKVGTSFGVLIPMEVIAKEGIKEGEEVEISMLKKRKLQDVLKAFGTAKGTEPFERDREDRLDREGY